MDPITIGIATFLGLWAFSGSSSPKVSYNGPIPKTIRGVPFAKPTGRIWPVANAPREVAYFTQTGGIVGNGATAFGATREDNKRIHAGNDLPAGPSNKIVSMENGIVLGNVGGYVKLESIAIQHPSVIAVYAEIALGSLAGAGLKTGSRVKAGQIIGQGSLNYDGNSMLHLELWSVGHAPKFFTPWYIGNSAPIGLLDPTEYLLALRVK